MVGRSIGEKNCATIALALLARMSDLFSNHPRRRLLPGKYRKLCEYIDSRDQFCLFCGSPHNGTPAHVVSRAQSGDDSRRNIIKLCIGCHRKFDSVGMEAKIEMLPEWIVEMLSKEDDIWK